MAGNQAPAGQRGSGARAVLVKNDQMIELAPGVFPLGGGKLWPPTSHTASPTRAPLPQLDHVVMVMVPCAATTLGARHTSTARNRATSTVAGGDSLPVSPGPKGTAVSSSEAICRIVSG